MSFKLSTIENPDIILKENKSYIRYYEIGYSSKTYDNKHIIVWDFDVPHNKFFKVIDSLKEIQRNYDLSNIYIFMSRIGFNAICLDKITLDFVYEIYSNTKYSDKIHNDISKKRGLYILRIARDKKFYDKLINLNDWNKSNAHRIMLNKYFKLNIKRNEYFDDYKHLTFEKYIKRQTFKRYVDNLR